MPATWGRNGASRQVTIAILAATLVAAACQQKQQPAPEPKRPPEPIRAPEIPPPPRIDPPIQTPPPTPRAESGLRELFPHVRADLAVKVVEFDGMVPINCHDPATPDVFLEVIACTRDTKEHEALVVTDARPSHIHAALLAIGLQPGTPGSWLWENGALIAVPPKGDPVEVTLAYRDETGREISAPAHEWVRSVDTGAPFVPKNPGPRWLFAGSVITTRQGREVYEADGAGTLIGLTTFGSETIAWVNTLSPESSIEEPEWIADRAKVPRFGTPIIVRIRPAR